MAELAALPCFAQPDSVGNRVIAVNSYAIRTHFVFGNAFFRCSKTCAEHSEGSPVWLAMNRTSLLISFTIPLLFAFLEVHLDARLAAVGTMSWNSKLTGSVYVNNLKTTSRLHRNDHDWEEGPQSGLISQNRFIALHAANPSNGVGEESGK